MINLTPEFWLQTAVYLLGGTGAVVAVAFRIGHMEASFATKEDLKENVRERNDKIDRVYVRFDDFKRLANEEFVRKDMCGQLHISTKDELERMDDDYKNFRHEMRNTLQQIFDKIDEINRRLSEAHGKSGL